MAFLLLHQSSRPTFEPTNERSSASQGGRAGGLLTEGRRKAEVSGYPGWEFPCQWAHLTASLMDHGDVPQGSRWDSVVSSVTAGEGWSDLMHNGGSADLTTTWLLHWCGSSSISMSILQSYWNINCCLNPPWAVIYLNLTISFKVDWFVFWSISNWVSKIHVHNNLGEARSPKRRPTRKVVRLFLCSPIIKSNIQSPFCSIFGLHPHSQRKCLL